MSEETKIQWTMHTGGPWLGCTEVSPGCANCYARELMVKRLGGKNGFVRQAYRKAGFTDWETRPVWGDKAPRVLTKGFWNDARRIQKQLSTLSGTPQGAQPSTPCYWFPSLIDWLDDMPAGILDQDGNWLNHDEVFVDFLKTVLETPNITWQLLTKRPENFRKRLAAAFDWFQNADGPVRRMIADWLEGQPPTNAWIGATVEDQPRADTRIKDVLEIPAAVTFLSVEPMLAEVNLRKVRHGGNGTVDALTGLWQSDSGNITNLLSGERKIDWIIVGGESGSHARPCKVEWIREVVKQCREAGTPVFVKQLGSNLSDFDLDRCVKASGKSMAHPKGGDPAEWPADLRVREFPSLCPF